MASSIMSLPLLLFQCVEICHFEHYLRRVIRLRLETVPCMS